MKKIMVLCLLTLFLMQGACLASIKQLKTTCYTVQNGDTLASIALFFGADPEGVNEAAEGIFELNYDRIFLEREKAGLGDIIYPDDKLQVNYWQ